MHSNNHRPFSLSVQIGWVSGPNCGLVYIVLVPAHTEPDDATQRDGGEAAAIRNVGERLEWQLHQSRWVFCGVSRRCITMRRWNIASFSSSSAATLQFLKPMLNDKLMLSSVPRGQSWNQFAEHVQIFEKYWSGEFSLFCIFTHLGVPLPY